MGTLRGALTLLSAQADLPDRYRDRALQGDWSGFRELHIEPDCPQIYQITAGAVQLARIGPHPDSFRT